MIRSIGLSRISDRTRLQNDTLCKPHDRRAPPPYSSRRPTSGASLLSLDPSARIHTAFYSTIATCPHYSCPLSRLRNDQNKHHILITDIIKWPETSAKSNSFYMKIPPLRRRQCGTAILQSISSPDPPVRFQSRQFLTRQGCLSHHESGFN